MDSCNAWDVPCAFCARETILVEDWWGMICSHPRKINGSTILIQSDPQWLSLHIRFWRTKLSYRLRFQADQNLGFMFISQRRSIQPRCMLMLSTGLLLAPTRSGCWAYCSQTTCWTSSTSGVSDGWLNWPVSREANMSNCLSTYGSMPTCCFAPVFAKYSAPKTSSTSLCQYRPPVYVVYFFM